MDISTKIRINSGEIPFILKKLIDLSKSFGGKYLADKNNKLMFLMNNDLDVESSFISDYIVDIKELYEYNKPKNMSFIPELCKLLFDEVNHFMMEEKLKVSNILNLADNFFKLAKK